MIDINELRKLAKAATPPQGWYVQLGDYIYGCKDATDGEEWQPVIANTEDGEPVNFEGSVAAFIAVASPTSILELLDRLEAAESEALEQARLNGIGAERELALMAKLEAAEKERDALRTELNEIRYGVAVAHDTIKALRAKVEAMERQETPSEWFSWLPEGTTHIDKLDCYLIPHYGFKAYFKAFKYVDGVLYSYRTDSDNEYGQWIRAKPLYKEGRVPAVYPLYAQPSPQPAPSIPEGWKLVPIEPTDEMVRIATAEYVQACSRRLHPNIAWRQAFKSMLAAAPNERSESPEAKP